MRFEEESKAERVKKKAEEIEEKTRVPVWILGLIGVAVIVIGAGFLTGTFQKIVGGIFGTGTSDEVSGASRRNYSDEEKIALGVEDTGSGVEIVCEIVMNEADEAEQVCHPKGADEGEDISKTREEKEKAAREEKERQEKELAEARAKARENGSSDGSDDDDSEDGLKLPATGIAEIAECPSTTVVGEYAILSTNVLPKNASNKNIVWLSSGSGEVSLDYKSPGTEVLVDMVGAGYITITAMSVDGGYSETCSFRIVEEAMDF